MCCVAPANLQQWLALANLQLPRAVYCVRTTVSATRICVASASCTYDATTDTSEAEKITWQLAMSTLAKALTIEDLSPHHWVVMAPTYYKLLLNADVRQPIHWLLVDV